MERAEYRELFWKPQPDPTGYANLLKVAYKAVKDADPTATVLNGGMAGNSMPFLEEIVASGAGNTFDILAIHPYAIPDDLAKGRLESRPDVHKIVEVELYKYRAFLERHHYNRPIWVTELGWPAGDWQLDAQAQADYLAQGYAEILATGLIERVFWYSFKDEGPGAGNSWGLTAWGIGLTDLAPKRPAFSAYATSAAMLAAAIPKGRIQLGNYSTIDDFETAGAWTRTFNEIGQFETTTEQHHTGSRPASAALQYKFDSPNQAVDFAPPTRSLCQANLLP